MSTEKIGPDGNQPERPGSRRFDTVRAKLDRVIPPEKKKELLAQAREAFRRSAETARTAAAKGAEVAQRAPEAADQLLTDSRESRLALQREQEQLNPVQRFFGRGAVGWLARSAVQSIPFVFFGYGVGDVVTGISALTARDVLDGERLDKVDRVLYGVATLIPFVPATILVSPMRMIRRFAEDAHHAYKTGNPDEAAQHAQKLIDTTRELKKTIEKKKL